MIMQSPGTQPSQKSSVDLFSSDRPAFPWACLNLWRNPFGELTRAERVEIAIIDDEDLSRCSVADGEAVQLIGDCGRGKTTRMLTLAARLPDAGYVYLPEDGPCPAIPDSSPLLIDEAQRLSRRVRNLVFRQKLPLILATHDDLGRPLRHFGYSVRTIRIGRENTPELICRMLNRRIEASRLAAGNIPQIMLHEVETLTERFGSNVRAMEHFLYEQVQNHLRVNQDGEVRFID